MKQAIFKTMLGLGLALSAIAGAAAPATVTTDLNLRRGPGTGHAVIATLPSGAMVDVDGCNAGWCSVAYGGARGFASRAYLAPAPVSIGGPPLLGAGIPALNLRDMGTSIGSLLGLDLGFLAPPSSSEGGYYPPNRRLFPAYGDDLRHRTDIDPGAQYGAPPPAARQRAYRSVADPGPEIYYGSPAPVPMTTEPDARSNGAAAAGAVPTR